MFKFISKIKALRAFLTLVKDPTKTNNVFILADEVRSNMESSSLAQTTIGKIFATPGLQEMYVAGYNPRLPALNQLKQLPEGSLGRVFVEHMTANGLEIEFYPHLDGTSPFNYILERVRKSHDFWHILTGFDTRVSGELALQAFSLAQLRTPFSAVVLAGGVLHILIHNPTQFHETIDQIAAGYRMGLRAQPLVAFKFEEVLNEDVQSLRLRLGLLENPLVHQPPSSLAN